MTKTVCLIVSVIIIYYSNVQQQSLNYVKKICEKVQWDLVTIKEYTTLLNNECSVFVYHQIMPIYPLSFYQQFLNTPLLIYRCNISSICIGMIWPVNLHRLCSKLHLFNLLKFSEYTNLCSFNGIVNTILRLSFNESNVCKRLNQY